jgi:hypothetical protein
LRNPILDTSRKLRACQGGINRQQIDFISSVLVYTIQFHIYSSQEGIMGWTVNKPQKKVVQEFKCEQCSFSFAEIIMNEDGKKSFHINGPIGEYQGMKIVDPIKKLGVWLCPKCKHETPVDYHFLEEF